MRCGSLFDRFTSEYCKDVILQIQNFTPIVDTQLYVNCGYRTLMPYMSQSTDRVGDSVQNIT